MCIRDSFVGPLGKATEIEGLKNVCVVGGGVGCAIALPIAQALHEQGTKAVSYTHLDVYKRQILYTLLCILQGVNPPKDFLFLALF